MASRTLLQLVILTARQTRLEVVDGTFNGSGNTTTTGQVTALENKTDSRYIGQHLYIDGGTPTIRSHVVKDFTRSDGELTWYAALGAAPDSLDFLILPYSRDEIVNNIVDAVNRLHDEGVMVRQIVSEGLVGGSPLYNAGWDYWTSSSVVDGWAANGSGTVARERASANIWSGQSSLKLSTTADYVALGEPWKRFLEDFKGETVRFFCPVKASNASHARINLYDGSDNYSSYHTGGGGWEILDTGDIAVSATATDLEPRLYNDDTNAVYFGRPWLKSGISIREYPFASGLFTRVSKIERMSVGIHPDSDSRSPARHMGQPQGIHGWGEFVTRDEATSTEVGIIRFDDVPAAENVLRMHGSAPLAVPSSDSDEVEVTESESYLLADMAASMLLEERAMRVSMPARNALQQQAASLRVDAERIKRDMTRARAQAPVLQRVP